MTTAMSGDTARKVTRGLGWSIGGNLGLRLITVGTNIVMARLIAPAEFGVFAVALTIWVIVGTMAEFGLGSDLIRAYDPARREPTSAVLAVGLSCLLAALMVLTAVPVAAAFGSAESAGVVRLMAISTAISGFGVVPMAELQRELRQAAMVTVNVVGAVGSAVATLSLASLGVGAPALAWGQIVGQGIVVIGAYLATRTVPRFGFVSSTAASSLRFCLPLAAANLLSWLLLTLDNLVVARTLGPIALGFYVLAFNVSSWPMSAIGQSLRVVALPVFSRLDGEPARAGALLRTLAPMLFLAAPIAMLLSTMSGPLVDVLYGERWHAAAAALAGLAVFGGLRVVLDFVATFLIAAGTTAAVLVVQVVWLAAMLPALALASSFAGLRGAGWAHVVVALAVVLPGYAVCLRRVGVDIGGFGRACVRPLLCLVPATVACVWLSGRATGPLALLMLAGLAAVALYGAPLARWWVGAVKELRRAPSSRQPDPLGQAA